MRFPGIILVTTVFASTAGITSGWETTWGTLVKPSAPLLSEYPLFESADEAVEVTSGGSSEAPSAKPGWDASEKESVITPDEILRSVHADLVQRFDLVGELVLIPDTQVVSIPVPGDDWFVELVPPYPADLGARMHVRYRLSNGFSHQPPVTLSLRAEWWRDAVVARRLVRAGDLEADSYSVESVNWLQHRGALVPGDFDLATLRLKATWRASEPLRWSHVETRPLIRSGSIVDVIAREGALRITMRGVAMENGNVGDVISVRNLQSRQEIQGIINDAQSVLVVF